MTLFLLYRLFYLRRVINLYISTIVNDILKRQFKCPFLISNLSDSLIKTLMLS